MTLSATLTTPPLTTVRQPCREMGEAAARILMAQLDGTTSHDIASVVPCTLTVRGSTRPRIALPDTAPSATLSV